MSSIPLITEFAPAERQPIDIVHRQAAAFSEATLTPELLNSVLNFVLILNQQRQIVFASRNVRNLTPADDLQNLLGKRPGEALGCVHSAEMEAGCGTSVFCQECGAVKAILTSLTGQSDIQECRVSRIINCTQEALDLLIYASPFVYGGETFSIFSVADISHQKRRQVLERIFFHDLINSAGGVESMVELLQAGAPETMQSDLELMRTTLHDMMEEVFSQKDLAAAENNELQVCPVPVNSAELLKQVMGLYQRHSVAKGRQLQIAPHSETRIFASDPTLLKRVLGNLLKNALEACPVGQVVTAGCSAADQQMRFWVHNPSYIPRNIQLQLFNRSFSTKGTGRGLGTYSIKLLAETYLKGKVDFESTLEEGTTFSVTLPKSLSAELSA